MEKKRELFSRVRSNKKWMVGALAVVAVVVSGGVFGYQSFFTPQQAKAAFQVETVKRGDISEVVQASGTVQASKRSSLSFSDAEEAKDAISTIQVGVGDVVKTGQVLATMDDSVARIQVTNAEANLLSAQAKLKEAQKRKSPAEITSLQAEVNQTKTEWELAKQNIDGKKATNDVENAKANLESAQKTYTSQQALFSAGAIAKSEFDSAQSSLDQAQRDYNAAVLTAGQTTGQAGVKVEQALAAYQTAQEALQQANEGPDAATVLSAKAAVEQAKAGLQQAQKAWRAVTLKAPMDGVIVQVNGNVGEIPGNNFIIMDNSNSGNLEVLAQISQSDIGKVQEGMPVTFTTNSYTDETFRGKVKLIYPEAKTDSGVTTYDVLLSVANQDNKLKIGMTMNVAIERGTHKNVLVVPAQALQTQNGKDGVYVLTDAASQQAEANQAETKQASNRSGDREGRANMPYRFVPIQMGYFTADQVEVTEGLTEGDRVVILMNTQTSSASNQNGNRMGGSMPGFGGMGGVQIRGR
ncbi:efflux RND transporter periplasmic adaptor subunit [Brevibacillus sp. 179-C8.2 HS]